jgi:hypothetical protein
MYKIMKKQDLKYVGGHLVDDSGVVMEFSQLAREISKLVRMIELYQFLKENETEIREKASTTPVVYTFPEEKPARISIDDVASTPLIDAETEHRAKIAEEWLDIQRIQDIQSRLDELTSLANWLDDDLVVATPARTLSEKFATDPHGITREWVISVIRTSFDPEILELLCKVRVQS